MLNLYNNPNTARLMEENDRLYAICLEKQFKGFHDGVQDDYFSRIYESLKGYASGNEKVFSQLKHLCYDLSNLFAKSGECIHKIVSILDSHFKQEASYFQKIEFEPSKDVTNMNKKLLEGLSEWGSQLIIQKKFIIDNMAGFFHYKKHEFIQLGDLLNLQSVIGQNCRKKVQTLEKTKLKLYDSKKFDKWQVNKDTLRDDYNVLIRKYETIAPYILPHVF